MTLYTKEMLEKLISQFHDKPVLAAELKALGEEFDEFVKAFDELANHRWIDTGYGVQLDGIGDIVGRDRTIENAIQLPFFGFFDQPEALGFEVVARDVITQDPNLANFHQTGR